MLEAHVNKALKKKKSFSKITTYFHLNTRLKQNGQIFIFKYSRGIKHHSIHFSAKLLKQTIEAVFHLAHSVFYQSIG